MCIRDSFLQDSIEISNEAKREIVDILFDPQTSGGLLIAISEKDADTLLKRLEGAGESGVVIGQFKHCLLYTSRCV